MRLEKITPLKNGKLLFAYWANNRNRGKDNCSLLVVPEGETRTAFSRNVKNVIVRTRTPSWRGDVNMSRSVLNALGITKDELTTT